jgi:hypothetical protein
MTHLILQDYMDASGRNLVQVLLDEKMKMFGIKKARIEERVGNRSFSRLFGVSSAQTREARASAQPFRSCQIRGERRGDAGT